MDTKQQLIKLAKEFLAFNEQRDTLYSNDETETAFEIELEQRDVGTVLAELILEEELTTTTYEAKRYCDTCGDPMYEGYCVGDGEQYYCSDECLFVDGYTPEQRDIDYDDGVIYYTTWED